jgi:hypothetical protein
MAYQTTLLLILPYVDGISALLMLFKRQKYRLMLDTFHVVLGLVSVLNILESESTAAISITSSVISGRGIWLDEQ